MLPHYLLSNALTALIIAAFRNMFPPKMIPAGESVYQSTLFLNAGSAKGPAYTIGKIGCAEPNLV
jgi:hypothetical protein